MATLGDNKDPNKYVKRHKPKTLKMAKFEYENPGLKDDLENMSKDELVKLVTELGKNDLRHANYNIAIMNERMTHFEKGIQGLERSIEIKKEKARKYRNMGDDPKRAIAAIERIIKNDKKKIEDLKIEVGKFEEKKSHKAIEQQNSKKQIDKKLVRRTYKLLEKDSDPVLVDLLEAFVALLRNQPSASKEDVELYLKKHEGLQTAMNKVDPRKISGANAKKYSETIERIRNSFKDQTEYAKYIPYLVFLNQTCSIVSLTVQEREIESQIRVLEDDIKTREKEIDEIETFTENVYEVIDYDAQVAEEKKTLTFMRDHYRLLQMRMYKLQKYSRLFKHFYFRDIKDKKRLNTMQWEKIDTLDDLDNLKDIDQELEKVNLLQSVTRILKVNKNDNPLGDKRKVQELEKNNSIQKKGRGNKDGSSDEEDSKDDNENESGTDYQTPPESKSQTYGSDDSEVSQSRDNASDEEESEEYSNRV